MSYKSDIETNNWRVFTINDDYRWVLLVTMLLIVHYFYCVVVAAKPRGTLFTQEWMEEKFGKEHEQALGTKI